MPAPATRKVEVDGRISFVPLEEAELADLIREGILATAAVDAARQRLDVLRQRAIAFATPHRRGRSSVELAAINGSGVLKIVYRQETKVDDQVVRGLAGKLPQEVFELLFDARVSYRMRRGWQQFMKLRHDDPTVEKLKPQIASAIAVKPCAPAISFLANPQPDEADHE